MESLTETPWDVIISGTGLTQSLLALALSRSDKKVLHVDKNPYYGGPEAAFSLQEAKDWAAKVSEDPEQGPFEDASVYSPEQFEGDVKLSSPRAYTLSLSPHLIYSRSSLLPILISSKVYRQLEFQAVGSWWIQKQSTGTNTANQTDGVPFSLYRVPGTREDVFADDLITVKSKRTLMRFLRHITKDQQGGQEPSVQEDLSMSLPSYLVSKFQVPDELHSHLQSLSLSQKSAKQTSADYAVPRIKRHLASIGVLGPGFGSLLAKWGGGSEIAQVGCRALAVGGGTYVLGAGIHSITDSPDPEDGRTRVRLFNGETVRTKFVVGSHWDLPAQAEERQLPCDKVARSISVVSSSLDSLFAATAEGAPIPAGTVVVFPGNLLGQGDDSPPVYLQAHSSDTGEVPTGQSVIYGSVSVPGPQGQSLLESAVNRLLQSTDDATAKVLWSLRYTQLGRYNAGVGAAQDIESDYSKNIICLPPPSLDVAFDDTMIGVVKAAWKVVVGGNVADEEFMKFEDREGAYDEE